MKENVLTLIKQARTLKCCRHLQINSDMLYLSWGEFMTVIIGAVLVILVLLLAGVDITYIIMGIAGLVALAALFSAGFFIVCWALLIGSEKKTARFVRFERGARFEAAVYLIDGAEYRNVFPAEFVMRDKLYRSDRIVTVRLAWNSRVFDRNALITSVVGLPVSLLIAAGFSGLLNILLCGLLITLL